MVRSDPYSPPMKPRTSSKRTALAILHTHPPLRQCFYGPKPNQGYAETTENEEISEIVKATDGARFLG